MFKKLLFLLIIIFSALSSSVFAEEYVFTTGSPFPMVYSDSVKAVNARHNVYTTENLEDIQYLIDSGIVKSVEPMSYSELFSYTPSDKYYSEQTNLSQINAPFAWDKGAFGKGVKIAVIDSGVYTSSADFTNGNIILANDYINTDPSSSAWCEDDINHGSMVTGIIASAHNAHGIAGISPQSEIYVFKCFYKNEKGEVKAKNTDIMAAMYEAIDVYDCDIINLSSGTTNSTIFKDVTDYAAANDVLIVAAAGNDGTYGSPTNSQLYYPASYDSTISVGSVDKYSRRASHSQRNELVNMMAPGEDVFSVDIGSYRAGSGTSFATPQVVAAAALAKGLYPYLTSEDITNALYSTCDEVPLDRFSGHGVLNIQAFLTYLKASDEPNTLVVSENTTSKYAYCFPSSGYISYFALYKDGILTDIKSSMLSTTKKLFPDYVHYVWQKDTLSPSTEQIIEIIY